MIFLFGLITGFVFCFLIFFIVVYLENKNSLIAPSKLMKEIEKIAYRKGRADRGKPIILKPMSQRVKRQNEVVAENVEKGESTPIEQIT